jgi:hypothetical protein
MYCIMFHMLCKSHSPTITYKVSLFIYSERRDKKDRVSLAVYLNRCGN